MKRLPSPPLLCREGLLPSPHVSFAVAVALLMLGLPSVSSSSSGEGKALMDIKASFGDAADRLPDWDIAQNNHLCSWAGVLCDNASLTVVSLNLSNLNLGGGISPAIGDLRNLQSIDLQGNKLNGQIPDEIGDCSVLIRLDLSYNLLSGDIPFSISKLKHLEFLNLKNNQLTGPVPSTLTQIPNLKTLDLARNQLTGEIPRLIYWNEVLQYLGLRGNSLSGTLSPDMCQLTGLWFFDVRGNNLTGTIPDTIGNCTSFEILDLSYNQLSGEIPYNIGFLQVATLSLEGNRLTGKIPEVIGLMQALAVLDLSENDLVGPIPPILGNLSYTGKLYLHGNKLSGRIPPEIGNMSRLSYLQLNDNMLSGEIPPELGKLDQLFELNLSDNNLEGPIPENLSSCTALNQINLHGNRLSGTFPSSLRNLQSLTYLNLSANNFNGTIPAELGHIINLDTLDLSSNCFSGALPSSLGDLEHLLTLNLSRNILNGPLPSACGNLKSVQIVDFSFNNLSGSIPWELGQLQNIETLILNNNNLYGGIPDQLTNCFSLATLNLSYNNLSGYVPSNRNFSRFCRNSFIGNNLLCGDWAGFLCGSHILKRQWVLSKTAVACLILGVIILLSMFLAAIYKSKKPKEFVKSSEADLHGPSKLVILHMDMAIHTLSDIMRLTDNLSEKYVIGCGASSTVYKCVLKSSRPIAIKRLYNQNPHDLHEFETELAIVGSIRHRNLVTLHGYALSAHGNLLFYDYMQNGSLWDLLHGPSTKVKLDWQTRLRIAVGAAQGLAYLHHDCNPRIIHRDIKSSNILLDENFEAHLSDFGIARSIPTAKTHASTYVLGTIGYIDPEYARTSRLTEKSDVYSFGIVLLELLTGKKAVDNECNLLQMILTKADNNTVMESVDPEVSVTCIDHSHIRKVFQLALLCAKRHPADRPTMHEVSRVLVSLLPESATKNSLNNVKNIDYAQLLVNTKTYREQFTRQLPPIHLENSSSDAQWILQYREAVPKK
ncbi:hypothetical protein MLD38_025639 [Melastoma candidum]|uniref:Uncharacterized protein n=1 Tax=Melastoma candidum TaxID=119954 RepID=A0ACB9NWF9_9MYRT|nr:hypothetical protein MLD38_025639 [Melastoma candidum]